MLVIELLAHGADPLALLILAPPSQEPEFKANPERFGKSNYAR